MFLQHRAVDLVPERTEAGDEVPQTPDRGAIVRCIGDEEQDAEAPGRRGFVDV